MTLGDLVDFKTNSEDADFWLVRKGTESVVGKPIREYNPENIGVKIKDNTIIDSSYLYYYFMFLHGKGIFSEMSRGTTRLQNIKISDIKKIKIDI